MNVHLPKSPLNRLSDLYDTDLTLLGTYEELDPFQREGIRYRGAWGHGFGSSPHWPSGNGKRVFAYLKNFAGLANLLEVIRKSGFPAVIFGVPKSLRFDSSRIVFTNEPIELSAVGKECDFAITHATHGTTAGLLLAGKPLLLFPLNLEQRLTGVRSADCSADECAAGR